MAEVNVLNVQKTFEGAPRPVLKDISFRVGNAEFVSLLGPSGCGKTTMLRIIAGLEEQTAGSVAIGGRDVGRMAPRDRDMSFVFQNYALYPHFSVRDNISLGLKLRKVPGAEIEKRVASISDMLGLEALLERKPRALSGGQRQRVALARALIREPQVFLLDEPLSNLDAKLRDKTRGELKMLFKRVKGTVIYVTHDQVEAMTMSDKIVIMHDGMIQQVGTPNEIYEKPANVFVATFIGTPQMNIAPAAALTALGLRLPPPPAGARETECGIRPEHLELSAAARPGWAEAKVEMCEPTGAVTILTLSAGGNTYRCSTHQKWDPAQDKAWFTFAPERVLLFDKESGARLA
jgi:ABC-type sugar transport system ATPase subunit